MEVKEEKESSKKISVGGLGWIVLFFFGGLGFVGLGGLYNFFGFVLNIFVLEFLRKL